MVRTGTLLLVWLGLGALAAGQQVCPRPEAHPGAAGETSATAMVERVEHMLEAARHLEAAGMTEEARQLRARIDDQKAALRKRAEALEAEVQQLRRLLRSDQQVLVEVKLMEINRSKLRALGFDFATAPGSAKALLPGAAPLTFKVLDDATQFSAMLRALREDSLARVLAEPTLVTSSGRRAWFLDGGEFPVPKRQPDGSVSIDYERFGTQLDVLPVVLEGDRLRLELRPRISEIDTLLSAENGGQTVPALRVREIETSVEMRSGQTLVIGGPVQKRERAANVAGKKAETVKEEIELVMLVRPEIVRPDAQQMGRRPVPPAR